MSSQPRIEIQGQAPFKQSGVYEAQISVLDTRPSDEQLRSKKFTPLWQGNFHLKVKDGVFSEIIGDSKNPLPTSVDNLNSIWVVVSDLFSSVYSIFDVTLKKTSNTIETPKDVYEADGAFFTGTAAEIAGIESLDGYKFKLKWEDTLGSTLSTAYLNRVQKKEYKNFELV